MAKNKKFGEFESLGKCVTPKGIASWAFLTNAQEDDQGREKFRITLFFDPSSDDVKKFSEQLKTWRKDAAKHFKVAQKDVTVALKKTDAETIERAGLEDQVKPGFLQMEFNCIKKGDVTVPVVDGTKQPCDEPWKGAICRVQANATAYKTGGNIGVKLYLAGVQVIEQSQRGGSMFSTDMFEEEDIDFSSDDDNDDDSLAEEEAPFDTDSDDGDDGDDDLDF